jgi:multicomponent Na+:H+ antiporter subunit A
VILAVVLLGMGGLALLVPPLTHRFGRDTGYFLAAGFVLLAVLLSPSVAIAIGGDAVEFSVPWIPPMGISAALRLDGLGALFASLVIGVGALILAYCPRYLHGDHHIRTYVLLTLFAAAMLGLVLAADLVVLFVFWELTAVSSFFLIGGTGPRSAAPAKRALLTTAGGGVALLVAVVMITAVTGTTDLATILADPDRILDSPFALPIALLIMVAAFTKSAQLPFHTWLPGAMVAITPVSAYLHAATMVKAGIYLLMRMSPVYAGLLVWQVTLIAVGLLTAVVGAALALRQHDLKALLAYSTVSQLGLLVAVTGVGTPVALAAATVHTIAHALFKATLFMLVGIIDREAGSRDIRELGGLRRVMPVTATLTGLAGLSMAGVPPLIGFVSKETIFQGLAETAVAAWSGAVAAGLGVAASALTFAYGIRIFRGAFAGPTVQRQLYEPAWQFLAPAAVPAVAGLVLGMGVAWLDPLAASAVADMAPGAHAPHLALWHGFSPELWLSVVTISVGMGLFFLREPVERSLHAIRTPPEGSLFERGYDASIAAGGVLGTPHRSSAIAGFLAWPLLAVAGLGVGALVVSGQVPTAAPGTSRGYDWAVVGLLAAAATALVLVTRALAAIALLGVIGLLMSIWFMLAGAADVALTLFLAEALTAVVAVLVLRALPPRFRRTTPRRAAPAAVIAGVAGVLAAAATLGLTGWRDRSALGDRFIRQAEQDTGGTNVVNTILVDYRALDTLGEATVLGVAALGLLILLSRTARPPALRYSDEEGPEAAASSRRAHGTPDGLPAARMLFQVTNLVLAPAMLLLSAFLFLRGHSAPGGGFIAALVAGASVAFGWFARGRAGGSVPVLRSLRPRLLVASGLVLSVAVGLVPMLVGQPFLTQWHTKVAGLSLSTSLLFDLGVYLFVLGLVVAAVDRLGTAGRHPRAVQARLVSIRRSAPGSPGTAGPGPLGTSGGTGGPP